MSLQKLKSKIDEMVKGQSSLLLDETSIDSTEFSQILGNVPGRQLVIGEPAVSDIHDEAFTVSGKYTAAWVITGIPSKYFALENITVTLSESNGRVEASCRLTGMLGASRLPAEIALSPEGGWRLALSNGEGGSYPFGQLLTLALGGTGIGGFAPLLEHDVFKAVSVDRFEIQFDAHQVAPTYLSLTATSNRPWEVVPGLLAVEEGFRVEFDSMHSPVSDDLAFTSIGGAINGSIKLGSQAYDMQISLNDGEQWEMKVRPEKGFPDPADLASLAGGTELKQLVRKSLSAWGFDGFAISAATIGFDPVEKAIAFVSVDGSLSIAETEFDMSVWLPEFGLCGRLAKGYQLNIGQLLERFAIPSGSLPELTISDLVLSADPKNATYALQIRVDDDLQFAPIPAIPVLTMQDVQLQLTIDPAGGNTGLISGVYTIAGVEVELTGMLDETIGLTGTIPQLHLADLFDALLEKASLPIDLPDVLFSDLQFFLTPATGALALNGRARGRWNFPAAGSGLVITRVEFELNRSVSEAIATTTFKITISGDDAGAIAEGWTIKNFSLTFSLDGDNEWSLSGDMNAALFDADVSLKAGYAKTAGLKVLRLSADSMQQLNVLDLEGLCTLSISDMAVDIGKATAVEHAPTSTFDVTANGRIAVAHAFDYSGQLKLYHRIDGATGLAFKPDSAVSTIPLPVGIPGCPDPSIELEIGDFAISRRENRSGTAKNWIFEASAAMQLQNIPAVLRNYFPEEKLSGYFFADGKTVVLRLAWPDTPQPRFPEVALKLTDERRLSLGQPELQVKEIMVDLSDTPKFIQKMTVSSIGGFNKILGMDASGRARHDFLNDQLDVDVTLSRRPGIVLRSSPFKPLKLYEKDGHTWWDLDLGDWGLFHVQIPEFSYGGSHWEASAGLEVEGDVKFPLAPLKFILKQSGLPDEIVDFIPAAIPLKDVNLADKRYLEDLKQIFGGGANGFVDRLFDILEQLQTQLHKMPNDFIEYADLHLPRSIAVDVGVNPAGSFHLRLSAGDGEPLRFMLPMIGPLPGLTGLAIYSLSVGMASGGSLVLLEIDGNIDFFDLPAITAALAEPEKTKNLRNRIICRETLAVLPTAAPVPVPLFYKHLGWELSNLLGMQIGMHWMFPQPEGGLFAFIGLFGQLWRFFSDPLYLLHKEGVPDDLQMKLTIGPNFLSLPPYLGGRILGLQEDIHPLDVDDSIARLLDALKTGNVGYLIQAIPLKVGDRWIRIGDQEIRFGPLSLSASWCVTTEAEFVQYVLPEAQKANRLPPVVSQGVLDALPEKDAKTVYDKGFIVLLMGGAGLGPFGCQTQFGMAVTTDGGFETGFRLFMDARVIALTLSGRIQADEKRVEIEGQFALKLQERTLIDFSGLMAVSDTAFEAAVTLVITPAFKITGGLTIDQSGITLDGNIGWDYGPDASMTCRGAATFSDQGMELSGVGEVFGVTAKLRITAPGEIGGSWFSTRIELELPDFIQQFDQLLKEDARDAKIEIDRAARDVADALDSLQEVDWNISNLRKALATVCDTAIAETNKRINKLPTRVYKTVTVTIFGKKIKKKVRVPGVNPRSEAREKAPAYIQRLKNLKAAAATDDRQNLAAAISGALNELMDYKSFRIRTYTITVVSDTQINQMRTVRDNIHKWVNLLPEKESGVRLSQEKLDTLKSGVKGALGEIGNAIEQGVQDSIPTITAIWFESELQSVSKTSQNIGVNIRRKSKGTPVEHRIDLDFTNPGKSAAGLYGLFRDTL